MPKLPVPVRGILNKVAETSPSDLHLLAGRFHDHAVEERMSVEALRLHLAELGFSNISAFCEAAGIPSHVAKRWERFGVSSEMQAVLAFMLQRQQKFEGAVQEFETITHSGLIDFLRGRAVLKF